MYLAKKHNRPRLHDAAWEIAQAINKEDHITGAEILDIDQAWWEKKDIAQAHVKRIRAVFGTAEVTTPAKAPGFFLPPRVCEHSCYFLYVRAIC